jgi:hypothetical protein
MSLELSTSWLHAISTAMISFGGYPVAPEWYRKFTNTKIGQIVALTILIFQAGGRMNLFFSLIVAIVFFAITMLMKNIHIVIREKNESYKNFTDKYF